SFYRRLSPELQARYLRGLPPVEIAAAGQSPAARRIRRRIKTLDNVIDAIQRQRLDLLRLAIGLECGLVSARDLHLPSLLALPEVDGVELRYRRRGPGPTDG